MRKTRQLDGLQQVSELQFYAAQTEMAELLRKETALRRNLEQLMQGKASQARAPREADDAALIAGADIRWHRWVDQRRARINIELAQLLALKENCRARLKQAFGRDQVVRALRQRAVQAERRDAQRRQDYES